MDSAFYAETQVRSQTQQHETFQPRKQDAPQVFAHKIGLLSKAVHTLGIEPDFQNCPDQILTRGIDALYSQVTDLIRRNLQEIKACQSNA